MNDRTIVRACRAGAKTVRVRERKVTVCSRCRTTHYRRGRYELTCPPESTSYFTPEEIALFLTEAREQRLAEDLAAYEARKAS